MPGLLRPPSSNRTSPPPPASGSLFSAIHIQSDLAGVPPHQQGWRFWFVGLLFFTPPFLPFCLGGNYWMSGLFFLSLVQTSPPSCCITCNTRAELSGTTTVAVPPQHEGGLGHSPILHREPAHKLTCFFLCLATRGFSSLLTDDENVGTRIQRTLAPRNSSN